MRVLFLDFDGVLHAGPKVVSATPHWCWLPVLAQALARHEDVRIVVHSIGATTTTRKSFASSLVAWVSGSSARRRQVGD